MCAPDCPGALIRQSRAEGPQRQRLPDLRASPAFPKPRDAAGRGSCAVRDARPRSARPRFRRGYSRPTHSSGTRGGPDTRRRSLWLPFPSARARTCTRPRGRRTTQQRRLCTRRELPSPFPILSYAVSRTQQSRPQRCGSESKGPASDALTPPQACEEEPRIRLHCNGGPSTNRALISPAAGAATAGIDARASTPRFDICVGCRGATALHMNRSRMSDSGR